MVPRSVCRAALAAAIAVGMAAARGRAEPAPPRPDSYDAQRLHMHGSYDLMRAIERLLLRGMLDEAKRFAGTIAGAPEAPAHGAWASHVVLVRDRAAALARATSVAQAVAAHAQLSAACAGCHVELGVPTQLAPWPALPPDEPTVEARMRRHRWAADRMWEGVIGGGDAPWRAGLDVVAAPALVWEAIAPGRAEHARQLRTLAEAARGRTRVDADVRAKSYGELLVVCVGCHAVGQRPPASTSPRSPASTPPRSPESTPPRPPASTTPRPPASTPPRPPSPSPAR